MTDMIADALSACDAWRDATDLVRMRFRVAWDIERVHDRRGYLWGVDDGVVYRAKGTGTRAEGLARAGLATRDGVTLLRSTDGCEVTAFSWAFRDDGRITQRLDASDLWLALERADGAGEDPEAYDYEVP